MHSRWLLIFLLGALVISTVQSRGTVEFVVDGDPVTRLGPPDIFPSIDMPTLVTAAEADKVMKDEETILGVFDGTEARAYSTWMLDSHEIVNDTLGDTPIAATW